MPSGRFAQEDLIGRDFNDLTAKRLIGSRRIGLTNKAIWECECLCGNLVEISRDNLISGTTKSCGCRKYRPSSNWCGVGDLSGNYWGTIRRSAKKREIEIDISIKAAWKKFLLQNQKCAITGVEIRLVRNYTQFRHLQTASLDRIDSTKGYTLDNVQWVHQIVQFMKMDLPTDEFIKWCKLIAAAN